MTSGDGPGRIRPARREGHAPITAGDSTSLVTLSGTIRQIAPRLGRPAARRTGLWPLGDDDREAVTNRDLHVNANCRARFRVYLP